MLDTNVVSDLMRDPRGYPKVRIGELGETGLAVSVIVAAELRYGAAKRGSERIEKQVESILSQLIVAPFNRRPIRVTPCCESIFGRSVCRSARTTC
jgi:tRNA(fMet)-specific endonuclease VapC